MKFLLYNRACLIDYKKLFNMNGFLLCFRFLFNAVSDEKSLSSVTHFHQLSKKKLILIAKKQ